MAYTENGIKEVVEEGDLWRILKEIPNYKEILKLEKFSRKNFRA